MDQAVRAHRITRILSKCVAALPARAALRLEGQGSSSGRVLIAVPRVYERMEASGAISVAAATSLRDRPLAFSRVHDGL